jgi:putative ABC transport system permease protein
MRRHPACHTDNDMLHDLRYAIRSLAKTPGFSLIVILALALGIGANTAIFTAANDFLLRPLPFADSARLVALTETGKVEALSGWTSPRDYLDWKEQNHVFEDVAAYDTLGANLTGGAEPERVPGMKVTANFFPVLGVNPLLGRSFLPAEDAPHGNPVVVLSYSLWQRRFGARRDILGQRIRVEGKPFTIIGIMPAGFWFSNAHEDFFTPLGLDPADTYRGGHYLKVIARLKKEVSREQAHSEMSAIIAAILRSDPENAGQGILIERLRNRMTREVKPALVALLAAVGLVLLIACANVANMLLARASAREKEIAVRRAVGASTARLVRQMLTESVLLALAGAGLGILFALWGVDVLYGWIPANLQPFRPAGVDWTVLGYTGALALLTGLLFGLAPAWIGTSPDLVRSLKAGAATQAGASHPNLRGLLVISEVALSVVLLAGAGVLIKSFVRLSAVDPGFRPEGVLTVRVQGQRDPRRFYTQVLDRAANLPGVVAAGIASNLPLTGKDWGQNLTVEDRPFRGDQDYVWACHRKVSLDYFRTIGMRLLKGRSYTAADTRDRPAVAVVNEAFAKKAWPNEDPVGKRFRIGDYPKYAGDPIAVIGVVADAKYIGLDEAAFPEMYFSTDQEGTTNGMTFVVRTSRDPHTLIGAMRGIIRAADPNQPIGKVSELKDVVAESAAPQHLTVLLGGIFGLLALVLAGTGLYGVISYSVAQRTHELGVRVALGASQARVVQLILVECVKLTAAGLGLGLAAALGAGRLLSGLLFKVSPHDPLILAGVSVTFAAIALAAGYGPARRAARTDPMASLRCQ